MRIDPLVLDYWHGIAGFGVIAIRLIAGEKFSDQGWERFENLHHEKGGTRVDLVEQWLKKGYGVGFRPQGGLYCIDLDCNDGDLRPPMLDRVTDFCAETHRYCPQIATPGRGLHLYARLPPDLPLQNLKHHVCRPVVDGVCQLWDLKLFERTLIVGPGTEVIRDGQLMRYQPSVPWIEPPIIDPRWIEPNLDLYHPEPEPYLKDERPFRDRKERAKSYVAFAAPVSVHGNRGSNTLRNVAEHLVAYLGIDPHYAFKLLTEKVRHRESWNDRCRGKNKQPFPWSKWELLRALERAVDAVPAQGKKDYQDAQRAMVNKRCLDEFMELLRYLPPLEVETAPWMFADDLLLEFLSMFNLDPSDWTKTRLGLRLMPAIRAEEIPLVDMPKSKARLKAYVGVSTARLAEARRRQLEATMVLQDAS
jgi:hypothetical protein